MGGFVPTPAEQAEQEERSKRASGGGGGGGDTNISVRGNDGAMVYGVNDKWIMLLRLLLRGATETDLKAWGMLYNTPGDDLRRKLAEDPAAYAQYLKDLTAIRSMLRRGEGGTDWVRAPQHTGFIFFAEAFIGSVNAAASDVRSVCGKHWVVDLDLMTHDAVRDQFAALVANKMLKSRAGAYARYGGTTNMQALHARDHDGLIRLFKRLCKKGDGMLGFANQIDTTGDARRAETTQLRRDYMAEHGSYYSDVYRY